jgi:hypothetical protein
MESRSGALGSENMQESQPDRERKAGRFAGRARNDIYLALIIGLLIGVLLTLLLGTGLYGLGYLSIGGTRAPLPAACPAAPDLRAVCPPSGFCPTSAACPPTATPPPTPNLRATATAACGAFEAQFPGTPCP